MKLLMGLTLGALLSLPAPVAADMREAQSILALVSTVADSFDADSPLVAFEALQGAKADLEAMDTSPECLEAWSGVYAMVVLSQVALTMSIADQNHAIGLIQWMMGLDVATAAGACADG